MAMSNTIRSGFVAAALLIAAGALGAQGAATDSRWEPWYGCWKPAGPALGQAGSAVCVAPLAANSVEITTLRGDTVVSHDTVVADGTHHSIQRQGCTGWQRATWSDDARRVYLHSDLNCGKDLGRTTDGMLAFAPNGDWLDIQALEAFGSSAVRVVRYQDAGNSVRQPAEVAAAVQGRELRLSTQRSALGASVGNKEIIDVAHHVDTAVVAAWVSERGQPFKVDAKQLVELANAGVPGSVTDVMVAMAYPNELQINREAPALGTAADSSRIAAAYMRSRYADSLGFWPYGWGPRYGFGYGYGYGMYGVYGYCPGFSSMYAPFDYGMGGCSPYLYGAYPGYGFGYPGYYGYGYGYPGYYGYNVGVITGPVVVTPHGVPVKGRGYTRPGSGGTAVPTGYSGAASSGPRHATASPDGYSGGRSESGGSTGSSGGSGGSARPSGGGSPPPSGGSSGGGGVAHHKP